MVYCGDFLLLPIAPSVSCPCLDALYIRSSKLLPSHTVSRYLPTSTTRLSLLPNPHPKRDCVPCRRRGADRIAGADVVGWVLITPTHPPARPPARPPTHPPSLNPNPNPPPSPTTITPSRHTIPIGTPVHPHHPQVHQPCRGAEGDVHAIVRRPPRLRPPAAARRAQGRNGTI